jgi:hypothetical protein
MMMRLSDGRYVFNPDKERVFIPPVATQGSNHIRPYVSRDAPVLRSPPITKWDYLAKMEETWGVEAQATFEKFSKMEGLGKKSGNLGKWGA